MYEFEPEVFSFYLKYIKQLFSQYKLLELGDFINLVFTYCF